MLSSIPSTPNFSIITVLDLSNCDDLHDSNISQLKVLTSLCVLDTSCTHLTDQATRNLASTLLLQEPGPLRLQSWSLRDCEAVTNRSIESLGRFPMLCLLDLRGTSVKPQPLLYTLLNWDYNTIKPPREHFDFFWPHPQSSIPALIQDLKSSAYSTRTENHDSKDKPQKPWVIHIDRQYPSNWGLHRLPYWKPAPSDNRLPWYSGDYSDGDVSGEDGLFIDGGGFYGGSDSGESFGTEEEELSPEEVDPSSPLEPTSSNFGDYETSTPSRMDPTLMTAGINDTVSFDTTDNNTSEIQSPSNRIVPAAASQSSPITPSQLVAEVAAHESASSTPGVPHFYNARAQAGLAPPKARKRRRRYSSASSESYDSDEEREKEKKMETELREERMKSISDRDWQLMLLREPPEWRTTETLMTTVRTCKQHRPQNAATQPHPSSAKKRKVDAGEMATRWAQIKASRKPPSQDPSQPATSRHISISHSTTNTQTHTPTTQAPTSTEGDRVPINSDISRLEYNRSFAFPSCQLPPTMDKILEKFNKFIEDFQHPIEDLHLLHPEKAHTIFHVALRGEALLNNPKWNKGLAFTAEERKTFGLNGRLPSSVQTLEKQCQRAYHQYSSRESPVLKNSFLQSLKQQNWVLYYSLLSRHLKEMMPIIYTPTEAEAIANYSHLFRRSEGLFLTYSDEADMERAYLDQTHHRKIDLIVVSDAEAILGIGDQGVGGIGISTAKATVYSLIGGIDPSKALSVTLDVGTDNKDLLDDELYVGWQHKRVRGEDYDRFVDKFVQLVRKHNPHSLLHFEDFGVTNAQRLLEKYRSKHAVFNDDVQGTGAVTLACLMAAVGVTKSKLSDQTIVVFGAGTAGLGITRQIRDAMVTIDKTPREEANKKFYLIDKEGLIKASVQGGIRHGLEEFVRSDEEWSEVGVTSKVELLDVVKKVKPTVLIGCSTKAGAFTEEVVREMGKHVNRPIIFPLSNPSRLVEVDPKDANEWTEGRALLATGSPFPPAKNPNGKEYIIAECNNALIYPGLGLGAIVSQSRSMSDTMLLAGTQALASLAPALKDPGQALLPDFQDARRANFEVAVAVAEQAIDEGSAGVKWKKSEVREKAKAIQWEPVYGTFKYDPKGEI
ncbi:unnamed protein product [Rhizoctonia solani]|uniref:Malic enzyme n=1 Tax=Rhizoctonia solani TaxID=456999 RepID=A0A8H3GP67_9AGAM|nr:unnamed protein product [Rhizoctonia solani]